MSFKDDRLGVERQAKFQGQYFIGLGECKYTENITKRRSKMKYVLTMIICAFVEGKTTCMPPLVVNENYSDGYSCMLDGYTKAYDKIVEMAKMMLINLISI